MKYIDFKNKLKNFRVFSLKDIEKASDKKFHRRRLNEWQNKNYIKKISKGYYIFTDIDINEEVLFEIANKIYSPSYISFESALSFYNLIPETVFRITSATTKKTYSFRTPVSEFGYRKIKRSLFFGYHIKNKNQGENYNIASIEKAILDYLYLNPSFKKEEDFKSLRLNKYNFFEQVEKSKFLIYLELFGQKSLSDRAKKFLEFMEND